VRVFVVTSGFACERLYPAGQKRSALHKLYESEFSDALALERGASATPVALTRKRKYTSIFLSSISLSCRPPPPNSPLAATIACRRILYARNASSVFEIHSAVEPTATAFILHTRLLFMCHGRSSFVSRNTRVHTKFSRLRRRSFAKLNVACLCEDIRSVIIYLFIELIVTRFLFLTAKQTVLSSYTVNSFIHKYINYILVFIAHTVLTLESHR